MVYADIILSAKGAGNFFRGGIAEMARVISNCTTAFACMSHMKSPCRLDGGAFRLCGSTPLFFTPVRDEGEACIPRYCSLRLAVPDQDNRKIKLRREGNIVNTGNLFQGRRKGVNFPADMKIRKFTGTGAIM
jgi:hypothetical protein